MILAATHKFEGVSYMLKIQEIREIIKLIDQSDIEEFVLEQEGSKIELKKRTQSSETFAPQQAAIQPIYQQPVQQVVDQPSPAITTRPEEPSANMQQDSNLHHILSPMVGTFYQSPSPDSSPYVQVGSKVSKETVVCIVEAMKLFNEIEAEVDGEITEVLVEDGQLVEYGQPLFVVKPR